MIDLHIDEALSRAVIGGLVTSWAKTVPDNPRWGHAIWSVVTVDGRVHVYDRDQASAFADAVFAAEVALAATSKVTP